MTRWLVIKLLLPALLVLSMLSGATNAANITTVPTSQEWCAFPYPANGGTALPQPSACASVGSFLTISATPDSGYQFAYWTGLPSYCSYVYGTGYTSASTDISCQSVGNFSMYAYFTRLTSTSSVPTTSITLGSNNTTPSNYCTVTGLMRGYGEIEVYNSNYSVFDYSTTNTSQGFPCGSLVSLYTPTQNFYGWTCTGQGCYAGANRYAYIVLNNNITETATS